MIKPVSFCRRCFEDTLPLSMHRSLSSFQAESYAQALWSVAHKLDIVEITLENITRFSTLIENDPAGWYILNSSAVSFDKRLQVLEQIGRHLNLSFLVCNFLKLLFNHGYLSDISSVFRFFSQLSEKNTGALKAHIVTAAPMSPLVLRRLKQKLIALIGRGDTLFLSSIDPSLKGGFKITWDNHLIDASLSTYAQKLSDHCMKGFASLPL